MDGSRKRLSATAPHAVATVAAWTCLGSLAGVLLFVNTGNSIHLWFWTAAGIYVGLFAAFDRQEPAGAGLVELRVRDADDGSPNVTFAEARCGEVTLGDRHELIVWQLWFRNATLGRTAGSLTRQLTARISLCDDSWQVRQTFSGTWASTVASNDVGWFFTREETVLAPRYSRAKLLLFGMHDTWFVFGGDTSRLGGRDPRVYVLAADHLDARPDSADDERFLLPSDIRRVQVVLSAANMPAREFRFRLSRGEDGIVTAITSC